MDRSDKYFNAKPTVFTNSANNKNKGRWFGEAAWQRKNPAS